ncbi:chitinase-like protein PB1E7.04c isoform X2 [Cajanus cajan]|nr:chitinase-like protein PB1E7.04c isoform X2 [Cajanus cajan]
MPSFSTTVAVSNTTATTSSTVPSTIASAIPPSTVAASSTTSLKAVPSPMTRLTTVVIASIAATTSSTIATSAVASASSSTVVTLAATTVVIASIAATISSTIATSAVASASSSTVVTLAATITTTLGALNVGAVGASDLDRLSAAVRVGLNGELVGLPLGEASKSEDACLIELVKKYGIKRWSIISKYLPGRIGKQCRERWNNHLDPTIKKDAWTEEEEKYLLSVTNTTPEVAIDSTI